MVSFQSEIALRDGGRLPDLKWQHAATLTFHAFAQARIAYASPQEPGPDVTLELRKALVLDPWIQARSEMRREQAALDDIETRPPGG